MTDAEQFLADLEAKAKAATPGPWKMKKDCDESDHMQVWDSTGVVCETPLYGFEYPEQWKNGRFIAAADPAAVLRLVGMVRHLAVGCDCDAEPCQYGHCTPTCRLKMAYTATENHHD